MIKNSVPILLLISLLIFIAEATAEQHGIFTSMLQKYVHSGKVSYRELCKDSDPEKYISFLKSTDPNSLENEKERLAFWINAYNAYTIKVICDNYPVKSINDLHSGGVILGQILNTTIWDKEIVIINNKATSLNNIEHKTIRPIFKDPRIHFALVCAAKSCPPLRSEAYEGSKLDQQLDDQARLFLSDNSSNRIDVASRKATISKIFDWYEKDFGKNETEVLIKLSQYLPDQIGKSIQSNPDKWEVEYTDYDWSLNE